MHILSFYFVSYLYPLSTCICSFTIHIWSPVLLGKVDSGSLIYDPFAGTGSLLIVASHFGAYSIGSDIDGRQIRGKAAVSKFPKKIPMSENHEKALSMAYKSIQTNVSQYQLGGRVLDSFVGDIAHHPFRPVSKGIFDAIITDPPYGISMFPNTF